MNNIITNGKMILNADDNYFNFLKKIAKKKNLKVISFGINNNLSNIKLLKIKKNLFKVKLLVGINTVKKTFVINKDLEPYLINILASITVLSQFFDLKQISQNIFSNFKIPNARGNLFKINFDKKSILVTDESYNSNPLSLKFAIRNFDNVKTKRKKINIQELL